MEGGWGPRTPLQHREKRSEQKKVEKKVKKPDSLYFSNSRVLRSEAVQWLSLAWLLRAEERFVLRHMKARCVLREQNLAQLAVWVQWYISLGLVKSSSISL